MVFLVKEKERGLKALERKGRRGRCKEWKAHTKAGSGILVNSPVALMTATEPSSTSIPGQMFVKASVRNMKR